MGVFGGCGELESMSNVALCFLKPPAGRTAARQASARPAAVQNEVRALHVTLRPLFPPTTHPCHTHHYFSPRPVCSLTAGKPAAVRCKAALLKVCLMSPLYYFLSRTLFLSARDTALTPPHCHAYPFAAAAPPLRPPALFSWSCARCGSVEASGGAEVHGG